MELSTTGVPVIRILPDVLASQVAAGEVVERPSSVIKELVENSLDAGAGEVLVEIRRGGAALMRVSDDGCGMSREDALLSLERHATSKLAEAADLHRIQTLGFRGEAVPSIASVSRFRMVTRPRGDLAGTEIRLDGGAEAQVREAGCAEGTMIEVRDLFFNVPARRKFLRTETTESAHIEHQLRLHALAADGVRFRFLKDERQVFELPAGRSRRDRVRWAVGTSLAGELIDLPEQRGRGLRVSGFVLPARHARKGRRHQCVFLNGRPVEDPAISRGLAEGFRGAVNDGLHPAAWLWIELDPKLVDVNVHPAKREIRLHRPHDLREAVAESVRRGLAAIERPRQEPAPSKPLAASSPSFVARPVAAIERPLPLEAPAAEETAKPGPRAPRFRQIGELLGRFALMESEDGLVMLDPRAARERILYERWLAAGTEGVATQALLVPRVIEPGPREVDLLLRHRELFDAAGFEIEDFGNGSIRLGATPAFLHDEDPASLLLEVVDDLAEGASGSSRFASEKVAAVLARRAARRESPGPHEAPALLEQLFACDLPYCAADGRPTLSEFSLSELEKRFSR
ncbi:DNA mismatch repair endonuclease MutL [Haloferula sp. A504]|uniref:DNA mismatch repair endonuclease MutL n=1 Tax=Haloferula sp. A504 TaxID=3373601 RepID=UPI0031CA65B1|nr:DNA mismatch repair endonuclease MutL [Verrucomicrobiaceae bacterium E54]